MEKEAHYVVGATRCLELMAAAGRGGTSGTMTQRLDLAGRAEKRGNLGIALPWDDRT